jgi:hypothetical protein
MSGCGRSGTSSAGDATTDKTCEGVFHGLFRSFGEGIAKDRVPDIDRCCVVAIGGEFEGFFRSISR